MILHKTLKYHEDTVKKEPLSQEDICFLKNLQKEMNTQDTVCQADPRFWVIRGSEKVYGTENADQYELAGKEDNETAADGMEDIFQYIRDEILPEINEENPEPFRISYDSGFIFIENNEYLFAEMEGLKEFLSQYTGYKLVLYENREIIYQDTMFLTEKAAAEHLKANHYHYSEDAHTYAMTAWRSPEVEKLWKIIQKTDWDGQSREER